MAPVYSAGSTGDGSTVIPVLLDAPSRQMSEHWANFGHLMTLTLWLPCGTEAQLSTGEGPRVTNEVTGARYLVQLSGFSTLQQLTPRP